jgi:hypothetical protein
VLLREVTTTGIAHAIESTAPACSLTWTPRRCSSARAWWGSAFRCRKEGLVDAASRT